MTAASASQHLVTMPNHQVFNAVAIVASAFHNGLELVGRLQKNRHNTSNKNPSLHVSEQKKLQDLLKNAETQLAQRFASDVRELGEYMSVGDEVARNRLLHIAVVIDAEINESLQLAVNHDDAVLKLSLLCEAAIVNGKDGINTLDELKQRIWMTRLLPRTLRGANGSQEVSLEREQTSRRTGLAPVPDNYISSDMNIAAPAQSGELRSGLASYLSMTRGKPPSTSPTQQYRETYVENVEFSPALNYFIQGSDKPEAIMTDIDDIISSYQGLHDGSKRDTWAILNGGYESKRDTMSLNREAIRLLTNIPSIAEEAAHVAAYPSSHPNVFDQQFAAPKPLNQRPVLNGTRWSASSSVYSDTTPPSLYHDSRSRAESPILYDQSPQASLASLFPFFSARAQAYAPPTPQYLTNQRPHTPPKTPFAIPERTATPSSPTVLQRNGLVDIAPFALPSKRPNTPIREQGGQLKAGHTRIHIVPGCDSSVPPRISRPNTSRLTTSTTSNLTVRSRSPLYTHSPGPSISLSNTSALTSHSSPIPEPPQMTSLPNKQNNYWGFCKGAWAIRESPSRGLSLQTRPDGIYNTHQVWQCRHCHFRGETFSAPHPTKKGAKISVVDPRVHTSAVGVRYRWIFLAKSHVRRGLESVVQEDGLREDTNYGCLICSVEGNVSGIYGNVETLMNHIYLEHGKGGGISERAVRESRCVIGRVAGVDEEWDVNIFA